MCMIYDRLIKSQKKKNRLRTFYSFYNTKKGNLIEARAAYMSAESFLIVLKPFKETFPTLERLFNCRKAVYDLEKILNSYRAKFKVK